MKQDYKKLLKNIYFAALYHKEFHDRLARNLLINDLMSVQPLKDYDLKKFTMPKFECNNPFPIISEGNRILSMDEIREVNKMDDPETADERWRDTPKEEMR